MYGDDLSSHSVPGLSAAIEMAVGLGDSEVHQVHICRSSQEEMSRGAQKIMEMMNLNEIPFIDGFAPDAIEQRTEQTIKDKMQKRVGDASLVFSREGGCTLSQHVRFGSDIKGELQSLCDQIDPDIVVFGRHELIHRKPFGIGQVPLTAMLNLKKPVVIAPGYLSSLP